ncbi:hypothetical protein PanWU01x14_357950 [Parasponia andersonii]|uniref:Uncharacterized protein n=1 Tax=Parasponia andersonii TaxID=3476 RepID=A0A2P5A8G1_PARAD|nr:hypothetical protein PanWU01x14_357950 [Parasponia andersonii]
MVEDPDQACREAGFFYVSWGAGGVTTPATYFDKIQPILKKYDILFIVDTYVLNLVGFLGSVLGLILNHFSTLFLRTCPVPKESFGWPLAGETLGAWLLTLIILLGTFFKTIVLGD